MDVEPENSPNIGCASGLMERFRGLMLDAMAKRNTKYWLGCILIATGDAAAEGVSLREYARTWGLTTAAVSKHCVSICVQLGIKPSRGMLSEEAREQYRKHNVRKVKL